MRHKLDMSTVASMSKSGHDYLTVSQAANRLDLSRRAVIHRITAGTISAEKIGEGRTSAYLIPRDEVERLVNENAAPRQTRGTA